MKRIVWAVVIGLLVLGSSSTAFAGVCSLDTVPAASLLFPYVVYDYQGDWTTLIAITNTSSEAQIVHVEIWTDYSLPILGFNIVLSGYDIQTINMRDIFRHGRLPVTGTEGSLIIAGPAPAADGPVSHDDGLWLDDALPSPESTSTIQARCPSGTNAYPGNYATELDQQDLSDLEFYLKAAQAATKWHSDCAGSSGIPAPRTWWTTRTQNMASWMYITADVVWSCNQLFPDQVTYFTEQIMYDNVLIGDVIWVDDVTNFSESETAVHLEADFQIGNVATLDSMGSPITYYYRYSTRNMVTSDYREPLPTAWALRYIGAGVPWADTYIRAWKGSVFSTLLTDLYIPSGQGNYLAYDCMAYTYWAWDEDELIVSATPHTLGAEDIYPNLLPLATQEVKIDEFNTPGAHGWMLVVWPNSNYGQMPGADNALDWYQTWMGVKYAAYGRFSSFNTGAVMANFNCYSDQVLPDLGVQYDYVDGNGYVSSPVYR